jgi:hypothetical protein
MQRPAPRSMSLAGREGVEPSEASFGDSPASGARPMVADTGTAPVRQAYETRSVSVDPHRSSICRVLEERRGFEPPAICMAATVFKTACSPRAERSGTLGGILKPWTSSSGRDGSQFVPLTLPLIRVIVTSRMARRNATALSTRTVLEKAEFAASGEGRSVARLLRSAKRANAGADQAHTA